DKRRTTRPELVLPGQNVPLLVLPYCKGLGEKIRRTGRDWFQNLFQKLYDESHGAVYEVLCGCSVSYITETGNSLSQRFSQQLSCLNHYKNALSDLQGKETKRWGRSRKTQPHTTVDEAVKASAIVEHASHCNVQLFPKVICQEEDFKLRKVKEGLFIRHNEVINRNKGKEVSGIWINHITIENESLCNAVLKFHMFICYGKGTNHLFYTYNYESSELPSLSPRFQRIVWALCVVTTYGALALKIHNCV
ncbi:hypothetical protein M513_09080, partial [Trichuris suis]